MAFLNTSNLPPNGYFVFIAETNFTTRKHTGLEDTVNEVKRHREANPRFGWATDKECIRRWVLDYTEARLRAMPGQAGMKWLVPDSAPPPGGFTFPRRQQQPAREEVVRSAVVPNKPLEQAKNIFAGIGLWLEWFGKSPVKPELAAHRASVCARCPLNEPSGNLAQRFSEATAKELLSIFSSLQHQKLQTPHDDKLGVCSACDCPMKAKVWSPIKIIMKHLREESFEKLHADCWILPEALKLSD